MSTRFTVQMKDGTRRPSFPNDVRGPFVINLFIGDSNFVGTDTVWSDDLKDMLPGAVFKDGTTTAELNSATYWGNWDTFAGTASLAVDGGRNDVGTATTPSGTAFPLVARDLGWSSNAGRVTVDPMWALAGSLQRWYQSHLSPGDGPGNFLNLGNFGQYWLKHAISAAGFARQDTRRDYHGSGSDPEELIAVNNPASIHPNAGDSATGDITNPLWDSLVGNIAALKTAINTYSANYYPCFDTVYLNASSFDMGHLGGAQLVSNFTEFLASLSTAIGLPGGKTPNVVMMEPLIGAFEPDRLRYNSAQYAELKRMLPSAAFVSGRDLAMNGKNHLSAEATVMLGKRLAAARNALPDAVIYEI